MKRFLIGLGALAVFVGGVGMIAYDTGQLVVDADVRNPFEGATQGSSVIPGISGPVADPASPNASATSTLSTVMAATPVTLKSFVGENFASLDKILTVGVPQLLINFAGLVTLIMFLINAVKFLFSAGNESGTADAKQGMLYAGIGFAVVILAFAIVRLADQIFK